MSGTIGTTAAALDKLVARLTRDGRELRFCYEAGPCGYGVYRHLTASGEDCVVVAPSLTPRRPADRVKTYRRDAEMLARTHRAGELVAVWVPDAEHKAMRGMGLITAVTLIAEVGDLRRFDLPPQLMAYLGLVPSEDSTGDRVRRGPITKTGNGRARKALVEAAWTYRWPARVSRTLQDRLEGQPEPVRRLAWSGQRRLCGRYRRLLRAGKKPQVVTTAIAREMLGFIWAIAREVPPRADA